MIHCLKAEGEVLVFISTSETNIFCDVIISTYSRFLLFGVPDDKRIDLSVDFERLRSIKSETYDANFKETTDELAVRYLIPLVKKWDLKYSVNP